MIAVKEIYKSGENPATSNYRPISFLPSFIKILENIVECQLQTHLSENILLTNVQFGFRKGKGTDQKMLFIQFFSFFIIFIIIFFFFIKKNPLDSLDRNIFPEKLLYYGISGN